MVTTPFPGPPRIQIQTQSGCNARCVFCPNGDVLKTDLSQGRMPESLFRKIIDELAQTRPRRISLYLMNEPLLDKRLPEFSRYVAQRVPETTTLVTSNGTNLTEERAAALLDSGLKRLKVSLQSLDRATNRNIMGTACDSEKVIRNVLGMRRLMDEKGRKDFDLRVSMVVTKQNVAQIEHARRFWKQHRVRLVTSALENRGGNIADASDMNVGEMTLRSDCIRPSREMCVLFNGDCVLCCVDWHRTVVLGNVMEQTIQEVWNNARYTQIRRALKEGDTASLPEICVNCTESACPNAHRRGVGYFLRKLIPA